MTREHQMIVAHKIGCEHARQAIEVLIASAKLWFKTEAERESFLAGYAQELRRQAEKNIGHTIP